MDGAAPGTSPVLDVASTPSPLPPAAASIPPLPFTNTLASITRLGLGAVAMLVSTVAEATGRVAPGDATAPVAQPPPPRGVLRLLPGALVGAGFEAERRLLRASAAVEGGVIRVSTVVSRRVPGAPRSAVERSLVRWNERARTEQARNELLMSEFVRRLTPELAEAIVVRLPLEEVVARVDMATLTKRLLENIDLAGIIRESTATVGTELVDAGRTQAVAADTLVERVVDRVLFRKEPRHLEVDQ